MLRSSGRAQVSTNLIDIEATPLPGLVAASSGWPAERGVAIAGSELVGLMPARVAARAAGDVAAPAGLRPTGLLEVAVEGEFGS